MPEIGFDEEPISPVNREETVTKRNPKRTTRMAPASPAQLQGEPSGRNAQMTTTSAKDPKTTKRRERSRSVRRRVTCSPLEPIRSRIPTAMEPTISGMPGRG